MDLLDDTYLWTESPASSVVVFKLCLAVFQHFLQLVHALVVPIVEVLDKILHKKRVCV